MIEIVFNESAAGSLKVAQHYGKGKYSGSAMSVFIMKKDGSEPTEEEKEAALREAQEKERLAWEQAVTLGGNAADVFCFSYALSIGDISENIPGEKRREVLTMLTNLYRGCGEEIVNRTMEIGKENLETIFRRSAELEPMRIWYSSMPDELCGMYWFMTQIRNMPEHGPIYLVELPNWEIKEKEIIQKSGWGELSAEEWGRYVPLQKEVPNSFIMACANIWKQLQQENAPLRVSISGRLVSVMEDFYDSFIIRELEKEEEVFHEAKLIGNLLGKYRLGISDVWYGLRIEEMIKAGKLEVHSEPAEEAPSAYCKMVRKTEKNMPL